MRELSLIIFLLNRIQVCNSPDLFICCNFSDSSVQEVRRYENTHSETTIGALMNVCQVLLDEYNINLLPNNPHGIKWKITKDGGCIIFPNNQQIDFIGYANGNKIRTSPHMYLWRE